MTLRSARAVAHSNIALVKYWGKSDSEKNLPAVPSLSLTLDALKTRTWVQPDPALNADDIELDGIQVQGRERARVVALLDRVRKLVETEQRARVKSYNDFPTAAGLASSASGFAALAVAAASAFALRAPLARLSALARHSSASAARSLFGGFVNLRASAEHAEPLASEEHWDLKLLVAITRAGRKPLGSTEAMQQTRDTSPYYNAWVEHAPVLHHQAERAVLERDFHALGRSMEQSTLMMHASMLAASPAIVFLTDASLAVLHQVRTLRNAGLPCYFTIDAGPHVKVLVQSADAAVLTRELTRLSAVRQLICCAPGPGARLVSSEDE